MISAKVRKKIKHIEIHTRRLLNSALAGGYRSTRRGSGFEFDQLREYHVGDDVRFIDWKSSARMGSLRVKDFFEERSRRIYLVVDASSSMAFGAQKDRKWDIIAEISAMLALVGNYGKDLVGLVIFGDDVRVAMPPVRGHAHVTRIMERLLSYTPTGTTNVQAVSTYLLSPSVRPGVVFLLSDFIGFKNDGQLKRVARKHELIGLRCVDRAEKKLPAVGYVRMIDSETGAIGEFNTGHPGISGLLDKRLEEQDKALKKSGIEVVTFYDTVTCIHTIVRLFRRRMRY